MKLHHRLSTLCKCTSASVCLCVWTHGSWRRRPQSWPGVRCSRWSGPWSVALLCSLWPPCSSGSRSAAAPTGWTLFHLQQTQRAINSLAQLVWTGCPSVCLYPAAAPRLSPAGRLWPAVWRWAAAPGRPARLWSGSGPPADQKSLRINVKM